MSTDRAATFPLGAQLTLEQLEHDPYAALATLQRCEPVSWIPALGGWLVTSRDLAIQAMRDPDTFTVDDPRFTTAAVLGPSMLSVEGAEHERHRTPFAPAFRPGIVRQQLDGFLRAEAARLVGEFASRGTAELRSELAGPLAVNTITRFLGLHGVTADEILRWYGAISAAIEALTVGLEPSAGDHQAIARVYRSVDTTLANADGATFLHEIEAQGILRRDEIGSATAVLMFGAIETAEGMTANALWHLLNDPAALTSVLADRSLVPTAIEESLRLEPAAAVVDRYTTVDTVLGNVAIPAGDLVTLSLLAANRDPLLFELPDRFDLDRSNARQHVTFVQGPHRCIGLHLARIETAAAIDATLDMCPGIRLDHEASTPPSGLIFRKPARLVAHWSP